MELFIRQEISRQQHEYINAEFPPEGQDINDDLIYEQVAMRIIESAMDGIMME
jgi:hypothetical protein